jgi:hypothetical protein
VRPDAGRPEDIVKATAQTKSNIAVKQPLLLTPSISPNEPLEAGEQQGPVASDKKKDDLPEQSSLWENE